MTYILCSQCKDGVVLVADKKFTVDGGSRYEYGDKLFGDLTGIIVGFSGSTGVFELFRTHIRDYVSTAHGVTKDKLLLEISQIIYNIDCRYGRRYDFDALIGIKSPNARSILNYFHPDGRPEPVTKYKAIGTGSSYGLIYLKQNWHEDLTMEQVAELG